MDAIADPSLRHVLAEDAPYLKNLAALWAIDPTFAEQIEGVDTTGVRGEKARSGDPTLCLDTADGRTIYLHSKYQPLKEAQRQIEAVKFDEHIAFYLHGLGVGHQLKLLFEKASDEALIAVFEPDLRIIRTAMEQLDLSAAIESRRAEFFHELDKASLFPRLSPHGAIITMGAELIDHAVSIQLHPDFHAQMKTWIGEFTSFAKTSLNTLVINGRKTAENISRNLGWYVGTPDLSRLKDRYKGMPAIIISAGPSLRKNKHLLHAARGNAVLIAVQTTLQPLLEIGIEPQYVTSLDYHEISTRFFEKLPRNLSTQLIAEPKANDAILRLNPGPLTLTGNEYAESLLREMKLNRGAIQAGATVAHLSYYLAEHFGCDPIVFVGQDLGFSDGLAYTPGTSYEEVWRPELGRFNSVEMKQWEHIVRDRRILRKIPDYQGRPMYTEERLFTYLQQFERDFAKSNARIIDATEGGAAKRGTVCMPLGQVIEEFCQMSLPVGVDEYPGLDYARLGEALDCLRNRRSETAQIKRIGEETLPLLEEIRDHVDDQPRVNRAIARIDVLRKRMDQLGQTYDLLSQLTQSTEMQRFKSDRAIAASRSAGTDRQTRQIRRDIINCQSIIEAARDFHQLMEETIAGLAAQERQQRTISKEAA